MYYIACYRHKPLVANAGQCRHVIDVRSYVLSITHRKNSSQSSSSTLYNIENDGVFVSKLTTEKTGANLPPPRVFYELQAEKKFAGRLCFRHARGDSKILHPQITRARTDPQALKGLRRRYDVNLINKGARSETKQTHSKTNADSHYN